MGPCSPYSLDIFKISCLALLKNIFLKYTQNHKMAASLGAACLKQGQSVKLCSKHRSNLLNSNQIMAAEPPEGPHVILYYCCIFSQRLKPLLFFSFILCTVKETKINGKILILVASRYLTLPIYDITLQYMHSLKFTLSFYSPSRRLYR